MDTFVTIEILLNHDWRGSRVCVYIPYLCLPPDSSLHQHTVYLAVNWSPLEMNSLEHWGGSRAVVYIESIHLHVLSMGHNLRLKNGVKCSVNKHVSKHIAILIARQGVTIQASSDGEGGTSTSQESNSDHWLFESNWLCKLPDKSHSLKSQMVYTYILILIPAHTMCNTASPLTRSNKLHLCALQKVMYMYQ